MDNIEYNTTGGVNAMLFQKSIDGNVEYALSFAGTASFKDALSDITQVVGYSLQYTEAVSAAKSVSEFAGNNELTFIGHSLGGGEASAASMATGHDAITFNPAALRSICDVANMPGDVTNYISVNDKGAPDIVTSLQLRLGMVAIGKSIPIYVGNVSSWEAHEIRTLYNAVK